MTREEAMAYAISKKAGIESEINKSHCGYGNWVMYSAELDFTNACISALKGPTREQVEKVRGEIVETVEKGRMKRVFSCCGCDFTSLTCWITPKFCPSCGAPMTDKAVDIVMERLEAMKDGNSVKR